MAPGENDFDTRALTPVVSKGQGPRVSLICKITDVWNLKYVFK